MRFAAEGTRIDGAKARGDEGSERERHPLGAREDG